jgi:hypothetical protein
VHESGIVEFQGRQARRTHCVEACGAPTCLHAGGHRVEAFGAPLACPPRSAARERPQLAGYVVEIDEIRREAVHAV